MDEMEYAPNICLENGSILMINDQRNFITLIVKHVFLPEWLVGEVIVWIAFPSEGC